MAAATDQDGVAGAEHCGDPGPAQGSRDPGTSRQRLLRSQTLSRSAARLSRVIALAMNALLDPKSLSSLYNESNADLFVKCASSESR